MQKPYYINKETGVKTEYDDYCYLNGEKVTVPPLSKKERDNIEKYITSIDLNGYYFDIPAYVGKVYTKYKLEFESPNRFTVTAAISGNSISNTGTYRVTKGYIVLHYDTDATDCVRNGWYQRASDANNGN